MDAAFDTLAGLTIADDHLRRALLGEEFLLFDGGMGTVLQERGLLQPGQAPDLLCLTNPEAITAIHAEYVAAGSEVITTNTFGSNRTKLAGAATVDAVYAAAASCARAAGARYVAADIGPTGALLEPMGVLTFDAAYQLFAEQARAAQSAGCDMVLIETFADLREAKAALLAVKENCRLPVSVSMTFEEDGRTFLGTPAYVAAASLSAMGANLVGTNCSLGPAELLPMVRQLCEASRVPVVVQPNAGLPRMVGQRTVYDITAEAFAQAMGDIVAAGANAIGGCCGTTPDFIRQLRGLVKRQGSPVKRQVPAHFVLTSAQQAVVLPQGSASVAVVGERINPTGKPKLKAALREANYDYVVGEAVGQIGFGADVLDVNVGLPELDEPVVLEAVVQKLQSTCTAPLVIDSSDPAAVERALRTYAGKPLINSVNGKAESLRSILPLAKKYGACVIGLTLDKQGIPPTAEGRFAIAQRIVEAAEGHGIPRQDVVIDCLTMSVATNQAEAREILEALSLVKRRLGVRTTLGVSNISFGLPQRSLMSSTFLAAAFGAGLDLPIINPNAARYRDVVTSYKVLCGQDAGAAAYIADRTSMPDPYEAPASSADVEKPAAAGDTQSVLPAPESLADSAETVHTIQNLILTGRSAPMAQATAALLENHEPLDVVDGVLIPTLDEVGRRFDAGTFFLPQLMASAEAVKAGFDVVKASMPAADAADNAKVIALATVEGDIHDIGKNIVKMLLENYGYTVVDLGKDVPAETLVDQVLSRNIPLVGLSALMTTTVRSMEATIALLRERAPHVKVFVGGAVLTPEYAQTMGADYYAKDAAESARIAEAFFSG
ncbi:MAG: homocysteine S-methyltransferase family protein [Coriobacteriia bacterium]|nr:homocysteine S-methyltransferase family protein [Coriobacteriia bacterium]